MGLPNVYQIGFKLAVIMLLFYSLSFLPSISGRGKQMRMVLGSSPPKCVGRCMGCKPCVAALVIPPHNKFANWFSRRPSSSGAPDETYYLLSWKCRCGKTYFQP